MRREELLDNFSSNKLQEATVLVVADGDATKAQVGHPNLVSSLSLDAARRAATVLMTGAGNPSGAIAGTFAQNVLWRGAC